MLRLVGELLVVLQTLLSIREVILKCALRIILRQCCHPIGIKKVQIIEVGTIGERALSKDDVPLAVAGIIEHRGNKTAGISAADIDHSRTKRAEDGIAIVEKFLGGPIVRCVGGTLGFDNCPPLRAALGRVCSILALAAKRCVNSLHLVVAARLSRVEEPLEFVGDSDFEMGGHGMGEFATTPSKLNHLAGDDFLRRGGGL